jgi:hypothetical protein
MRAPIKREDSVHLMPVINTGLGALECLPKWVICIPLVLQWLWLALRYGSLTLPSAANPFITSGGLVGEGKLEYFRGMGATARASTANYCAVSTAQIFSARELQQTLNSAGLEFPLIAKPDLGLCGYGVQLIGDMDQLEEYLSVFPRQETVVLQQYLSQDGEAGIFYVREPGMDRGRITGLALRYFPRVVGDGEQTIAELVLSDVRARRLMRAPRHEYSHDSKRIPLRGEVVRLSTIGSTRIGGLYRDGSSYITPRLTAAVDAIARDMPDFHFGRFDVRFENLDALCDGRGFSIMEINGAGSEAIQAWDPDTGILPGMQIIFKKQNLLFAVGHAMRARGVKPVGIVALARLNQRQQRLIAAYPPSN